MKLNELLTSIQQVATNNDLSTPFIVGGTTRDRVRGLAKEVNDIDLTSQNGDSVDLAFACSRSIPHSSFQYYDDGHCSIKIGKLKIDFSNHFIIPGIEIELDRLGVKDHTPLIKEMYSRDFTINTLLQDLGFENIYDITHQGVKDIKTGIIRTPINPELTISSDPKRILRALKFALKFNYTIDEALVRAIKKYRELLKELSPEYVKDKMNEIVRLDTEKALQLLIEYGLINIVPMSEYILDKLIEKRMLFHAL